MTLQTLFPAYQILLADDHVPFRRELKRIILETPGLEPLGEAGDGPELLKLLEDCSPDLVVLDISMPHLRGLEATKIIKQNYPQVKVLIMIMARENEYLTHALAAGADGVLLKQDAAAEFLRALEQLQRGEVYLPPQLEAPATPPGATTSPEGTTWSDFL